WTTFNTSNSELPGNTVFAVSIDEGGNKWIGTDEGLAAYRTGGVVNVGSETSFTLPASFRLMQNYPNPFNPTTTIAFELTIPSQVTLDVVDVLGQHVTRLIHGARTPGIHAVEFQGTGIASGTYFYRLNVTTFQGRTQTAVGNMVL